MIVFDTEDNSAELLEAGKSGFDKEVTQIAAISDKGNRFHNAGNPREFLKWCHEQEEKPQAWAFNCQYDIGNLSNDGESLRLDDFNKVLVKSRFIRGETAGVKFYDVGNIAGAGNSVGKLGLAVGKPKFGFPYTDKEFAAFPERERKLYRKFAYLSKTELFRNRDYIFRDCEIPMLWLKFVQEKCAEMGIENIPATLGGLCVKTFQASGGSNWHEATEPTKKALMGARVEIFNCGGSGRIAYTDVNSLYPWCMTQLFPEACEPLNGLDGIGIARADVEVPMMRLAPLPWRDEENRLLFPVGKFSGVWTIHELKNAVRVGVKILKVHWSLGSRTGKAYYRDYITTMYQNRLRSTSEAEKLFWKLLMNNLYGRLAIGGTVSQSVWLTDENKHKGHVYGRRVLVDYQMPLPEFTNYLHAAHVLSFARIRLYNFLRKIPADDLIYCDTDSAFFFCRDALPFAVGKELGEMKLEAFGSYCEPIAPKTYRFDDTYKAKGVPKKCAQEFIETGCAEYDAPFKMRESITFYEENNKRKLSVWRKVSKELRTIYDKKEKSENFYLPKRINAVNSDLSTGNDFLDSISG